MARKPFQAEMTTFVKGLITEANPLTFPENASLEEVNFVLNPDGSRQRRYGIDFEVDHVLVDLGIDVSSTGAAISSHLWTAVANRGDIEFAVVQVGNTLYFFDATNGPISGSPVNHGNTVTIDGDISEPISGTSTYGHFVVVHGTQTVYILTYDSASDTITVTTDRLKMRDLFGLDDGLDVDTRPTTLSDLHRYNLRNQGWPNSIAIANTTLDAASNGDPISTTFDRQGFYPSNADIVWACKLANAKDAAAINSFDPKELRRVIFGTTQAPLGRYIIDVFNRGQSRIDESGIDVPLERSTGGVTAVASYSGRVFYAVKETSRSDADTRSPNIGTMIFFSTADDSVKTLTSCYSEADPSAEHVFDPVATDGGFITISEAGEVLELVTMGQSLFVFCTNGVWEIHGGEEAFSATNQNVSKTTDIGVASKRSIVYAEDKIAYWALSGIYLISRNDLTLRGGNNDMTYATIQSLFDDIDLSSKRGSVGTYDPFTRTFRWLWRDKALPNNSFFNKELIYDVNLQAFYIFEIDVPTYDYPFLCGHISMSSILLTQEPFNVQVTEDLVTSDVKVIGDQVIIKKASGISPYRGSTKYLTVLKIDSTHKLTFSHYRDDKFRDWRTYDGIGIDAEARMLTGYATGGAAIMDKEITYLHVYLRRTEVGFNEDFSTIDPSSCIVQVQWDWTNHSGMGRWGREFEAYRLPRVFTPGNVIDSFDYGYTTVTTKNKLRGSGRAMSLLFKTKPWYNCHIYGWSISGTAAED